MSAAFYKEIECEHGWTDDLHFAHCDLGSAWDCCEKEDCPIYELEDDEEDERGAG